MHDPSTVAFQIRYPWKSRTASRELFPKGYRDTFLTVWHRDPERDGSDDSCGYTFPRLSDEQRESLFGFAWSEAHDPWFRLTHAKKIDDPAKAECLMRALIVRVCDILGVKASLDDMTRWAIGLVHTPGNNLRSSLCLVPGWHTNSGDDTSHWRERAARELVFIVARHVLYETRPWYRHPRWHVHHWRFQLHPIRNLKRRWWDRCSRCGKRGFKGSAVGDWAGNIWHSDCDPASRPLVEAAG